MENEMLRFWENSEVLNTILSNSTLSHIGAVKQTIKLAEGTKNLEIKEMYGNLSEMRKTLEDMEESYKSMQSTIKFAKTQIKFYKQISTPDPRNIKDEQQN